jgi:hypothetical protein
MKTLYEVLNIDLANEHTKARKLAVVDSISSLLDAELVEEIRAAIAAMDIPVDDERHHWIQTIARKAAADLLTIGKVQPEHMLEMASLPREDFSECVKVATLTARSLNVLTIAAEKDLNTDTISNEIV